MKICAYCHTPARFENQRFCSVCGKSFDSEKESHENDSFNNNLLDYPVYTKPQVFRGMKVPDVLLSGHHKNIANWRRDEQIKRTKQRRSDLLEKR